MPPAPLQRGPDNPGGLPVEAYDYDAVHNRIASAHQLGAWDYDANNRLLGWGSGTARTLIEYDDNGQTIAETRAGVRTEYGYGAAERLIEVRRGGGLVARYAYDPFGRRIAKDVTGQGVTWFVYAEEGLLAELDANGSAKRLYGWQPDTMWGTAPLHQSERLGQGWDTYALHVDHLGTPQRATDATGSSKWAFTSTSFGEVNPRPAGSVDVLLRFPGQYFDAELSTYYNLRRNYQPDRGRYSQMDPVGLLAGSQLYAYVSASPLTRFDPEGLIEFYSSCNDRQKNEVYLALFRMMRALASDCLKSTGCEFSDGACKRLRDAVDFYHFEAKISCRSNACGQAEMTGTIWLDVEGHGAGRCGCLEATLFHEYLHVSVPGLFSGQDAETQVQAIERRYFPCGIHSH